MWIFRAVAADCLIEHLVVFQVDRDAPGLQSFQLLFHRPQFAGGFRILVIEFQREKRPSRVRFEVVRGLELKVGFGELRRREILWEVHLDD